MVKLLVEVLVEEVQELVIMELVVVEDILEVMEDLWQEVEDHTYLHLQQVHQHKLIHQEHIQEEELQHMDIYKLLDCDLY